MEKIVTRPLKAFLCHASGDKPPVREFYKRLVFEGVDAWLDKEMLLPGQDWRVEIPQAVKEADVVIVFLSKKSISKEGYIQKEIKFALDIAEEKPEGTIFLIPARLEECVVPERLSRWHWVDLYEEDGFIKLLRSLKLRANAVGATVETALYRDTDDKEIEHRIEQLYTEGLAAFYTEDWDRACQRFQTIISEHPNHKRASEKMAEAEKQRSLAKSYAQAMEGYKAENWPAAIQSLEELLQKSAEYKDAVQLLKNARKQRQLKELYAEAKDLHAAEKWHAVLKVFEQISAIDPAYPDSDGLLPSAQKEVAELKRLSELNDLYSQAVREMDSGNWIEARRLLEQVHKAQTGFLETERLLRKVEDEIAKVEEHNKRNNQVNMLYEQAHGLVRSKKWRKVVEKLEEIKKLDEQFVDTDEIFTKARTELEREDRETQRQNELAATYAEAVRLLQEEKFQEALEKWQEVKTVEPKYPDRQWVQRTARKRLTETAKPARTKPRFVMTKSLWTGIAAFVVIAGVIAGAIFLGKENQNVLPISIVAPVSTIYANPTTTKIPGQTSTPRPSIPVTSGYSEPTMYDDFENSVYDDNINTSLWGSYITASNYSIKQKDGQLQIGITGRGLINLNPIKVNARITKSTFYEMRAFLDPATTDVEAHLWMNIGSDQGTIGCNLYGFGNKTQTITCGSDYFGEKVEPSLGLDGIKPDWHVFRLEIEPETMTISYIIDGKPVGNFIPKDSIPDHFDDFKKLSFNYNIGMNNNGPSKAPVGYIDYVRIGTIADDPTLYDNFNNTAFNGRFDAAKWEYVQHDPGGSASQQDGVLILSQSGVDKRQNLRAIPGWPLKLKDSVVLEANLNSEMTSDGIIGIELNGDNIHAACGLHSMSNAVVAHCWSRSTDPGFVVAHQTWHTIRIEVDVENNMINFFIDGKKLTEDHYEQSLRGASIYLSVNVWAATNRVEDTPPMVGYVDDVRVFPLR